MFVSYAVVFHVIRSAIYAALSIVCRNNSLQLAETTFNLVQSLFDTFVVIELLGDGTARDCKCTYCTCLVS